MAKYFPIDSIPAALLPEVGGKARGLHTLKKAGFSVPAAFIVTESTSDDSYAELAAWYEQTMPGAEVSVRSSATLEDGNDYSAAGQFSTYLNVRGAEAIRKAVCDCVASLHNATAEHYQKTFLQAEQRECKMTCVVQQMVDARCAGVIFTQAPMRAGFSLVEVVPGLGENLVSGKMAAQQYRVRHDKVEKMPQQPLLTREEACLLAAEGKRIEKLFGQPMDLEWAIDQEGHIQWLQARPITVEESVTMNELDSSLPVQDHLLTTANIGEVMPGAVTPLNISTSMRALDWGVAETYRQLGCFPGEYSTPMKYICNYYGHMFFDMSNMYEACHATYGSSKETLDISLGGHALGGTDIEMTVPAMQRIRNTVRFMQLVFGGEKAKLGMDKAIAAIRFDLSQDMHGIYQQILHLFPQLCWVQYYHYCTSYYSGGQTNFLIMGVGDKYADKNEMQSVIAGCLTELDEFESANVLRRMRQLAALMVKHRPEVASFDVARLQDYFLHEMPADVQAEYDAFMAKHGHRGIREMEIRSASWRDNVESFCSSMRSVLTTAASEAAASSCATPSKEAASASSKAHAKHWTDYAEELCQGASPLKRRWLMRLVLNARKGVGYREYTKAKIVEGLDYFKQAYAVLAKQMTEAGLLPDTDAIYFLTQDEVGLLLKGDKSLVKKALARRRLFPQQQKLRFPDTCIGIPQPLEAHQADPNATRYEGTPVSRGVCTGKARIVQTEDDAAALQPGEIMVVHGSDIGWTPYYDIVGGMVCEIGSALSHGIVVAREYALPTVVNVENALQMLHNGDEITIDGNTGMIFVEKRAE